MKPTFEIAQISKWAQEQGEEWLVEGLWADCAIGLCYGAQGSYKTWVSLDLAVSVATGRHFLGQFPVKRQGPVVLIQQEDRPSETAARVALIHWAKTESSLEVVSERKLHARFPSPPFRDLPVHLIPWGFSVQRRGWEKALEDILEELWPVLVIIDPLFAAGFKIETWGANLPEEMAQPLRRLREKYRCSFMPLHHESRASLKTGAEARPRLGGLGSILIPAAFDTAWRLGRKGDEEAVTLKAEYKHRGVSKPWYLSFTIDRKEGIYRVEIEAATYNKDDMLEAIQTMPGMDIPALAKATGRPRRTAYSYVKNLREGGLVELRQGRVYYVEQAEACTELAQPPLIPPEPELHDACTGDG